MLKKSLENINLFVRTLLQSSAFSGAATAFWSGQSISAEGMAGSASSLAVAALFRHGNDSMMVITPNADSADQMADDLLLFLSQESDYQPNVLVFPPMILHDHESESALVIADESFGERINILKKRISRPKDRFVIIVSMSALLQSVPPPDLLQQRTRTLTVGGRIDLESLRRFLVGGGYHSTSAIDLPGEFAVRGYILDIFAPEWEEPVRIELFHDEIESIRRFDLATQRSLKKISEIDLTRLQPHECVGASLLDYFPPSIPIILIEPEKHREQGSG